MKNLSPVPGLIYASMKKYRKKFVVIELILILFWIWYFCACHEYILTVVCGSTPLDVSRFSQETQNVSVGEPFELHRSDDITIKDYALRPESYWQGEKYLFETALSSPQKTSVYFTNATTGTGDDSEGNELSAEVYLAEIGDKKVLVLAYPHQKLTDGSVVEGIFAEIPLVVSHSVAAADDFEPDDSICKYMLDIRGVEMESENFDITFVSVLLAIIIFLAIKLVLQFKNYIYTPTYAQLSKYGEPLEIASKIESEFAASKTEKNQIVTDNWILSKDTFKLKIVKNHMKHGNFRYTPEAY